jgi:hypothetical protein
LPATPPISLLLLTRSSVALANASLFTAAGAAVDLVSRNDIAARLRFRVSGYTVSSILSSCK